MRALALLASAAAGLALAAIPVLAGSAAPAPQPPQPASPATSTPFQTPDTSACPNRFSPPAPVDLSEAPAPGQSPPTALPLPSPLIGGAAMADCGVVLPAGAPPLPAGLTPHAWLLADLDTGAVLAARDAHARHRPASLIKVLTALVVARELDPAAEVVGTDEDANQEGSRVGLGPEGRYTVDQLLHGLLMRSGNDAAHALAVRLGGVEATVAKMNALAHELGALDTRVSTPSGLDGPGTSTSAYDLALIFRAVMRKPELATIMSSTLYDFPGYKDKPGFKVSNDNRLLFSYAGALGGKTGFTDDARHTYAGAAQRGGRRLLVVLLRGEQEPMRMWDQAAQLLDYGFALPAGTPPVGVLVDGAPPSPSTPAGPPDVTTPPDAAGGTLAAAGTTADSAAQSGQPIVTVLAALCLLALTLVTALRWRRRSASPPP